MKKIHICSFLMVGILLGSWTGPDDDKKKPSRKLERAKFKAERSYGSLSYSKSIKRYKKVLSLKPSDSEATIRIADSYRRINDVEKAREWYKKAEEVGALTDRDDQLNYAQVLSSVGAYEEADYWYALHGEEGRMAELIRNKREAIKNIETYYQDTMAYFVDITSFNTEHSDFGPTYTEDGIVFASARPSKGLFKPKYNWDNSNFLDMFTLDEEGKAKKIQRGINTRYHEGPAVFFANDSKVIFTRNNYSRGKSGESEDGVNKLKLFFAEKSKNGKKWCPPVELPFNSDDYSVGHPTLSADGKTLYFASDMPGGEGGSDIYKSEWDGSKWSQPENLGETVNTPGNEFFPFVHNDETLFYSSEGMPGLGGLDVFTVSLDNPGVPKNVGYPINTNKDDFGIIMAEDGRSGYLSSNRDNGVGHDDIYAFERYFYDVRVKLVDSETKQPLTGSIRSTITNSDRVLKEIESGEEIAFRVLRGPSLQLEGAKEGYEPISQNLITGDLPRILVEEHVVELPLKAIEKKETIQEIILVENNGLNTQVFTKGEALEQFDGTYESLKEELIASDVSVGKVIIIRNIYYDFDKFNIRKDAAFELDRIVDLLNNNEDLVINLSAHTDARGSNSYNDDLAENRVEAAMNYLVQRGINSDRIRKESFGENQLFSDCKSRCTEELHQSNRRTEVTLFVN